MPFSSNWPPPAPPLLSNLTMYRLAPNPDGVTTIFAAAVNISPKALIVRNGLILTAGDDYTIQGAQVTMVLPPSVNDKQLVYQ
jgi:hypothetical protein